MEQPVVIEMRDIGFQYPSGRNVLEHIDFKLEPGEKIGFIGPNGSGKSTFLHLIMGLLKPSTGEIRLFGKSARKEADFRSSRQRIGILFQHADDQLFSPTVLEDVAFGPLNQGYPPAEARAMALKTLDELDLRGFEDRVTYRLSGGEKKLVALATVLVMAPDVLLLDEPTTGLDETTIIRITDILNSLEIGYIIVSHEYDFLALTTRLIYSFQEGRIVFNGDASKIHSHYHSHSASSIPHRHSEHGRNKE